MMDVLIPLEFDLAVFPCYRAVRGPHYIGCPFPFFHKPYGWYIAALCMVHRGLNSLLLEVRWMLCQV